MHSKWRGSKSHAVIHKTLSPTIGYVETIKSKFVVDKNHKIPNWLTTVNYGPQQSDCINRRHKGSGQWLLSSPEYHAWRQQGEKLYSAREYLERGRLSSHLLSSKTSPHMPKIALTLGLHISIAIFGATINRHMSTLLASLLKQLSEQRQVLPDCVEALFDHHNKKHTRPPSDEILRNLQSVAAMYFQVFIIIDALDECQERDGSRKRLLTQIFHLQTSSEVRYFATSRHIPNITDSFPEDTRLEVRAVVEDLRNNIADQASQLPSCVQDNTQLMEEVKIAILQAVDGMYVAAQYLLIRADES